MKVLVCCPCNYVTGGIELLHQLCSELNKYPWIQAKMWYRWYRSDQFDSPQPHEYDCYVNEYVVMTDPSPDYVLIFPEIWASQTNQEQYLHNQKIIYWESVDNYFSWTPKELQNKFPDGTIHLAQSYYAMDFLKNTLKIPSDQVIYVTDYLNESFLLDTKKAKKKKQVIYNPKKGMGFTEKIISLLPEVDFIPIKDMTREQVIDLMRESMVYIDFGNHPGKDRIPREACMCGCVVIVGKKGSARFREDVPIDDRYKFEKDDSQLDAIRQLLGDVLECYDLHTGHFEDYRRMISEEPKKFSDGVKQLADRLKRFRFSVIIPAHNSAKYVARALTSIRQQTFTDYELIVVCDSCTDDTAEIAMSYNANLIITDFHCDGPARSAGLDAAKGDYVLFMDDDDWWLHEYVLTQLDAKLKQTNNPDILCFSFIFKGWKYADPLGCHGGRWIACWNKCWKRSFIGETRFPNVKMSSDSNFHSEMFGKNPKVVDWDMPMYYYNFMRKGSQTELNGRK